MTARLATLADQEALYDLIHAMHAEAPAYRDRKPSWAKVCREIGSAVLDGRCFVVGPAGAPHGVLMGFIGAQWWTEELEARDMLLYLAPGRRGSRDFLRLVAAYEQWAAGHGVTRANLGLSSHIDHAGTASALMRLGYAPAAESYCKALPCPP